MSEIAQVVTNENVGSDVTTCVTPTFTPLNTIGFQPQELKQRMRINCFGSLFYMTKYVLGRNRLSKTLHKPLCDMLMGEHIKFDIEWPRDHFKSTIGSEGLPIWRILPFSASDEDYLVKLGYDDEFIFYMRRMHNPATRNFLVNENITNAAKIGLRIRSHFESNATFISLFPEILPDEDCQWSNYSLQIKLPYSQRSSHGEGTFDFLGIGSALQSRHYNGVLVEDDLVGRKAVESPSVMEKTIDYHRLLPGAFEGGDKTHDNDQLVIGNRWSFHDLGSYIRENEDWFNISSHSAEGGCCDQHEIGKPIFPEEWSMEKLRLRRKQLTAYPYSCQFLNNPVAPDNTDFQVDWLREYTLSVNEKSFLDSKIRHIVTNGEVKTSLSLRNLDICMTVDPNHSGNAAAGRCRHAIIVVGISAEGDFYLLENWAKASSYDIFVAEIYRLAAKYRLSKFGLETVAAQKYLAFYLDYRSKIENVTLRVIPLKGEVQNADGSITRNKEFRIRNTLAPIFETRRFWVQENNMSFIDEYRSFPVGKFVDQLDALAYAPNLLHMPYSNTLFSNLLQKNQRDSMRWNTPFGVPVRIN